MEARLRKFLSPRKHKARPSDVSVEVDLHGILNPVASSHNRLPSLVNQTLGKSAPTKHRKNSLPPDSLRSVSYEEAAPGKPPELGIRPHRGNGPVKLQTSRRLSSGELLVTQQDYDRTLEEIREGEYIVGAKERRTSNATSQPKSPTEPPSHLKFISTAPSSPRETCVFTAPSWQSPSMFSDIGPVASPISTTSMFGSAQRSSSAQASWSDYPPRSSSYGGVALSNSAPRFNPHHMASSTSLLDPHDDQNPTIQALWKAESTRLASIYAQGSPSIPQEPFTARNTPYSGSSYSVNQPHHPTTSPMRLGLGSKPNASTSNLLDLAFRDDYSDRSSHPRYSHISSSAASTSFTTGTSTVEGANATRDDIRKIVDDMRSNYLQAIEAHTPPLPAKSDSPRKPRPKKQTPSLVSYASVDSSLRSASRQSTSRTKSWQSSSTLLTTPRTSVSSPMMKSARPSSSTSRRTSAQHGAGIATLTPIEASPAKSARSTHPRKDLDVGLKRADSTTLGAMARKLTIVDDRNSTGSSQPASTPTFYNSSGSDSDSGRESTSPRSSSKDSPSKTSSVQHTPEKHKPSTQHRSPLTGKPWQIDVDQILPDEDLELALDIDDFETLCEDLFNSIPSQNRGSQLGMFRAWDDKESISKKDSLNSEDIEAMATPPAELRTSKYAKDQIGLGLTGLPALI